MKKRAPVPSLGRIVLHRPDESTPIYPASVQRVHKNPRVVDLMYIDEEGEARRSLSVMHGFEKSNCWWYPPREECTTEVDV